MCLFVFVVIRSTAILSARHFILSQQDISTFFYSIFLLRSYSTNIFTTNYVAYKVGKISEKNNARKYYTCKMCKSIESFIKNIPCSCKGNKQQKMWNGSGKYCELLRIIEILPRKRKGDGKQKLARISGLKIIYMVNESS